jgi:hypothetical protein
MSPQTQRAHKRRLIRLLAWAFLFINEFDFIFSLINPPRTWGTMLRMIFHVSQIILWSLVLSGHIRTVRRPGQVSYNAASF